MASNNKINFETRGGLTPNMNELPYSITTSAACAYLQDKLDCVCSQNPDDPKKIKITLATTEPSKEFLPFIIVLPYDGVVEDSGKKYNQKNDQPTINIPDDEDVEHGRGAARIRRDIFMLLKAYAYNENDAAAFKSEEWRRRLHISRETGNNLRGLRKPKVSKINGIGNGNMKVVMMLIDPIRVFYDMVQMDGDNRQFYVNITKTQKIAAGEYRYDIKRQIAHKGKGKNGKDLSNVLNDLVRNACRNK